MRLFPFVIIILLMVAAIALIKFTSYDDTILREVAFLKWQAENQSEGSRFLQRVKRSLFYRNQQPPGKNWHTRYVMLLLVFTC